MKPVNASKIALFAVAIFVLFSCSQEKLPSKKVARAYAEITFTEELYRGYPDSIKAHKKLILEKYGLKDSDIVKTMREMPPDKEVWREFFKEADFVLDSLRKAASR